MPETAVREASTFAPVEWLRGATLRFVSRLQEPLYAMGTVMVIFVISGLLQLDVRTTDEFDWRTTVGGAISATVVAVLVLFFLRFLGERIVINRSPRPDIVTRRLSATAILAVAVPISFFCAFVVDQRIVDLIGPWGSEHNVATLLLALTGVAWVTVVAFVSTILSVVVQVTIAHRDNLLRTITERDASNAALLDAHMETRRVIAEELHGHVQGRLVSMSRRIRHGQLADPDEIALILDSFAVETVREMSHNMYPSELPLSVSASLHRLCGSSVRLEVSDAFMDLDLVSDTSFISTKLRESIYFSAEEAVTNAVKHGDGKAICMHVDADHDSIFLEVTNSCDKKHEPWDIRNMYSTSFGMRLIDAWVTRCHGTWSLVCDGNGTTRFRAELARSGND